MAEPWDDSLKTFIHENPQDFVSWLLGDAQFKKKVFVDDNSSSMRRHLVDAMIALIEAATEGRWKAEVLFLAYTLYSRAFTEEDEQNWLRDRFAPFRQIMKASSIFQEMLQRDLEASKN